MIRRRRFAFSCCRSQRRDRYESDAEHRKNDMAAELDMTTGKAGMMFVGNEPWHGLGHRFAEPPTIEQAIPAAGLDWDVLLQPLIAEADADKVADHRRYVPAALTVRSDTNAILGVVGPTYKPLQNREMFEWFRPLVQTEQVHLETAGSLYDGKTVWCLAKMDAKNADITGDGDAVAKYLMLSNSHEGDRAVRVGFTPIRIVCWNTLQMAIQDARSKLVKVLHTKGVRTSLDELRKVMNLANAQFEATADQYRKLHRKGISKDDLRKYVITVLDLDKPAADDKLTTQAKTKIDAIMEMAISGRGNTGKTLWHAYNGVTEFLSYTSSRTKDVRMDSLWFGEAANLSARALKIAIDLAS